MIAAAVGSSTSIFQLSTSQDLLELLTVHGCSYCGQTQPALLVTELDFACLLLDWLNAPFGFSFESENDEQHVVV